MDHDPMIKIEFEAAEALAGLARFPANVSVTGRVKGESSFEAFPKSSNHSSESEKSRNLMEKSVKDEQSTELRLNPNYRTNCATSSGRKSRQNLTEAEMEARKTRRVLANRESARQTIRRRQAIYEELTRKAVDLAWQNENLKREKEAASERFNSLKTTNECLKEQMIKMVKVEEDGIREENESTISASSTNSPIIVYNQQPFLPLVWPSVIQPTNSVQLQCGSPAGIVLRSPFEDGNPVVMNGARSPVYLLPCPWLFTLPQNSNENRTRSFNLNDKPTESSECQQLFPEKSSIEAESVPSTGNHTGFPPDGGSRQAAVNCEARGEHDDTEEMVGEIHQVSGKRLCDVAAAAEARKRRKHLTRLKNHLHCRQLRMH